jgi:tyrosine-protein kinase Etk/Wzc
MSTALIPDPLRYSPPSVAPQSRDNLAVILRGKWIILLPLIVVTLLAGLYVIAVKPVYEATASVVIGAKGREGVLPFSFDGVAGLNKINNEMEILRSQSLAQSVVKTLLTKQTFIEGGKERFPIIETLSEDESRIVVAPVAVVMERLANNVDFKPIRESDVIRISAQSTDPREAAVLANVYAEAYVERNISTSRSRSQAVREFLQFQAQSKKEYLDSTESALKQYMRTSGTVALDDKTKSVVEQLSRLEASRDGIDVDMSSRQKTLDSYRAELARQEPAVARNIGESNDSYIRLLQDQLARLEVQRDVVIAQNPSLKGGQIYDEKLKEIDSQIISLKEKLQDRTAGFLKTIVPSVPGEGSAGYLAQTRQKVIEQQIELEGLAARKRALNVVIADYEGQFGLIPQKSIDLAKLQRARLSSEKLYLLVEEKYNEAAITEKSEFGYISVIDSALVPTKPVSPNVLRTMILAVLAGLGFGIVVVFLRERLNGRVQTPEDLRRFNFANVSTVGKIVPGMKKKGKHSVQGTSRRSINLQLIAFHNPFSFLGESYRILRTNLQFANQDRPLKSILVTSASPAEGKSTTVANLAITFAQAGKRVLLVDADMRRPVQHKFFNLPRNPGLSEYLLGTTQFENVVGRQILQNLDIICSGAASPHTADIWGSRGLREFMTLVEQSYDIVLLDSAPLLAVADTKMQATEVDGIVLVISSGKTSMPEVERAKEGLDSVGGNILGVLLNNFDPQKGYGYFGAYRRSYQAYDYGEDAALNPE